MYLLAVRHPGSFDALGIASFGPIDLNNSSPTYGYITTTPKVLWRQADIVGPLMEGLDCPFAFDTDVNAPAMSEFARYSMILRRSRWGCVFALTRVRVGAGCRPAARRVRTSPWGQASVLGL